MIYQTISNNKGIEPHNPIPGYRHTDALCWDDKEHKTYRNLAFRILEDSGTIFKKQGLTRILELGAGSGSLAWHLRDIMKPYPLVVVTLDGNRQTKNSPYVDKNLHFICRTDEPYLLVENNEVVKFDIILSYEHFEHIAEEHFDIFLDNMKNHCHEDTVIYSTAADWYFEDIHINIKNKEQWHKYLDSKGFFILPNSVLDKDTKPFNFDLDRTTELVFKLKQQ